MSERSIPHTELSAELHGAGEHAKRMIDHVIRAACLWLEDHQAETDRAVETSRRSAAETSPVPSDEPLLTAVELGAYLKMAPATMRDWARKGRIPFEPVGRERRFRLSAVLRQIEENKAKQSSPARDNGVELARTPNLRPQNQGAKSNGRV